jgi:hypothetical protein
MSSTPRTAVQGAHQMDLKVNAGNALSMAGSRRWFSYKRLWALALLPLLLPSFLRPSNFTFCVVFAIASIIIALFYFLANHPLVRFVWNCFLLPFLVRKPTGIDADAHRQRLELFYEGQADIYDVSRRKLLRGRSTMLKLCAAQLRQYYPCLFVTDFKVNITNNRLENLA